MSLNSWYKIDGDFMCKDKSKKKKKYWQVKLADFWLNTNKLSMDDYM